MADPPKTYSIQVRRRRVTHEDAYVAVPVTDVVMSQWEDGTFHINPDSLLAEALRIGNIPNVQWQQESCHTEPHPVQGPVPEGRVCLDAFYMK